MAQLSTRFTPVHIQSVQSSLFHDRKQGQRETLDTFAQELRALFWKAYPPAQMGSEEAEMMGRAVLTNQFISRLQPELKSKLAVQEGNFDQLLARSRFEEAKQREFAAERERRSSSRNHDEGSEWRGSSTKTLPKDCTWGDRTGGHWRDQSHGDTPPRGSPGGTSPAATKGNTSQVRCYTCGAMGHVRRNCPDCALAVPRNPKGNHQERAMLQQ